MFQSDATASDTSMGNGGCEPLPGCTSRTECTGSCGNACFCDLSAALWSCDSLCDCDAVPGGCVEPSPLDGGKDTDSESAMDGPSEAPDARICVPATCATLGYQCGYTADGCGGLLLCGGPCIPPQFCGGGGFNLCGGCNGLGCGCFACQPRTCAQQSITCGPANDGCGNKLDCGTCPASQTCGGGGVPGQCGFSDASACVPDTCTDQQINCGPAGDGCGSELMCGGCTLPQTCGGGGVYGQCGVLDGGICVGATCAEQNINCGPAGDGYGRLLQCGTCTPPQTCGGGGFGRCG
jgi:hypothetical protein